MMKKNRKRKRPSGFFKKFFLFFLCIFLLFGGYVGWIAYRERSPEKLKQVLMHDKNNLSQFFKPRLAVWSLEFWWLYDTKLPFAWKEKLAGLVPIFKFPYQCKLRSFSKNGQSIHASLDLSYGSSTQKAGPGSVFHSGAELVNTAKGATALIDCAQFHISLPSEAKVQFLRGDAKEAFLTVEGQGVQLKAGKGSSLGLKYPWGWISLRSNTGAKVLLASEKKGSTLRIAQGKLFLNWRGGKKEKNSKNSFLSVQTGSAGKAIVLQEIFPQKLYLGRKGSSSQSRKLKRELSPNQSLSFLKSGSFSSTRAAPSSGASAAQAPVQRYSKTKSNTGMGSITPILLSPKKKAVVSKKIVAFRWSHPGSNNTYILQLSRSSKFKKVSNFKVRKKSFKARLRKPGIYYWRVYTLDSRAKKKMGVSGISYFRISK